MAWGFSPNQAKRSIPATGDSMQARLLPALYTALVLTAQPLAAAPFADTGGQWAAPYIEQLATRAVIGGFPDGTFRPNRPVTRAEFAAILTRALNLSPADEPPRFRDVDPNSWAAAPIGSVSAAALVSGFPDGSFRPDAPITRAQALTILSKALGQPTGNPQVLARFSDGQSVPAWAIPAVSAAAEAGLAVNYPDPDVLAPTRAATRAEIAAFTYQTLAKIDSDLPRIGVGLPGTAAGTLAIRTIELIPDGGRLRPGETLRVQVEATPGARGSFSIPGVAEEQPLREVSPGVYEGSYKIYPTDNQASTRVQVTLEGASGSPLTQWSERVFAVGPAPGDLPD